MSSRLSTVIAFPLFAIISLASAWGQSSLDSIRTMQSQAIETARADWGYWGTDPGTYYNWCDHSNRLVPVYTFGIELDSVCGSNSVYRSEEALRALYGRVPERTRNPNAEYFDQTDIFKLQVRALEAGKKYIIVVIFDGMDWHTTRAAAAYRSGTNGYVAGRGSGMRFQDYREVESDYGFCVTAPYAEAVGFNVDSQSITAVARSQGGYDPQLGGDSPWDAPPDPGYLLGWNELRYHPPTDSAAAATTIATGVKTYNGSINVGPDGDLLEPITHRLQSRLGWSIGLVTDVPISHATPAAMYAHNVSRLDSQDLARDLLGVQSVSHRVEPLPGVDVLLGAGWGDSTPSDGEQGLNFVPGNKYITREDLRQVDVRTGGKYIVVERSAESNGAEMLEQAAEKAVRHRQRLLGIFGTPSGGLPRRTAAGDHQPVAGATPAAVYAPADLSENPTLAQMTRAALGVLSTNANGFWLMVEAGEVDWASHDANIDNAIGAILSGDEAFGEITAWVEKHDAWQDTAVIVTSDHGHAFVLVDPTPFSDAGMAARPGVD